MEHIALMLPPWLWIVVAIEAIALAIVTHMYDTAAEEEKEADDDKQRKNYRR